MVDVKKSYFLCVFLINFDEPTSISFENRTKREIDETTIFLEDGYGNIGISMVKPRHLQS